MAMALLPMFLEVYFFKNHSWVHDFAALKMVIPLSLVPFVLLPVWLLHVTKSIPPGQAARFNRVASVFTVLLLVLTLGYTLHEHPRFRTFFPPPAAFLPELGDYFATHVSYNDVVVSKNFEIPYNPPQALAYTMKRVYRVSSQADIDKITAGIHEPYRVVPFNLETR